MLVIGVLQEEVGKALSRLRSKSALNYETRVEGRSQCLNLKSPQSIILRFAILRRGRQRENNVPNELHPVL